MEQLFNMRKYQYLDEGDLKMKATAKFAELKEWISDMVSAAAKAGTETMDGAARAEFEELVGNLETLRTHANMAELTQESIDDYKKRFALYTEDTTKAFAGDGKTPKPVTATSNGKDLIQWISN